MLEIFFAAIGKCAVMIVYVKNVIGKKIVRNVNIFPTVEIDICDGCSMAKTVECNACGLRYIVKNDMGNSRIVVVPV